jgi:hypothetical protein
MIFKKGIVLYSGHQMKIINKFCERSVMNVNAEGRRSLERPRRKWEDVVRMDLREIGLGGVDWIRLAQDRVQ